MTGASKTWTVQESNAFIEEFELGPWKSGSLSGLQFAVSELIDIEEKATGCGNPAWLETRPPAACNALCLDILFASGAQCIGKTKSDEFTFGLLGENSFYGTPLNPNAPERVPGGSASGAASAVACGLVQFAVAVDSASSIQVTASNCGLYGWRSKYGTVPMAGVVPLAPSFDTIGMLAPDAHTLTLLAELFSSSPNSSSARSLEIHVLQDAFDLVNKNLAESLKETISSLGKKVAFRERSLSMRQICAEDGGAHLQNWYQTYLELYSMECWSSIGTWIEDRKPDLSQETRANVHKARMTDRSESARMFKRRETYAQALNHFLADKKIVCYPACSEIAPPKGFIANTDDPRSYYPATLSLASIAAIGRLAQLTIPASYCDGAPAGLCFAASDEAVLLQFLRTLET